MSLFSPITSVPSSPATLRSWLGNVARQAQVLATSSLLQKSGLAVLDQAVVSGTSFATSVLLARFASREELGIYYLALSVIYFARGVQEQLVSAPYMIYCSRKQGRELAEYAGSALLHQCGLLLVTAAVIAGALLAGLAPREAAPAFWLLVIAGPLILMREFLRQLSFAHLDLKAALVLDAAVALLQLGALVALAIQDRLTVTTTLGVLAVSSGVSAAAWLASGRRPMVGRWRAAIRDLAGNWTFARWALASQLLASTTPYLMPWVVAFTCGQAETGTLGACTTLVGLSNMFLLGLANFLSPRAATAYAQGGVAELRSVLKKTALLFAATLGTISLLAWVMGERVAILLYGPSFAGTGWILGVLSLSVLANSFGVTAGNGLWAMERPKANFVADLVSLVIVILVTVVAVPAWGPLGAALATLAGTASDAIVRWEILRRSMREGGREGGVA